MLHGCILREKVGCSLGWHLTLGLKDLPVALWFTHGQKYYVQTKCGLPTVFVQTVNDLILLLTVPSLGLFYKCHIPVTVLVFDLGTVVSRQIYKLQDCQGGKNTFRADHHAFVVIGGTGSVCVCVPICPSIPTYVFMCLHMPVFMWRWGKHGVWDSCRSFTYYRTTNISHLISQRNAKHPQNSGIHFLF